jgi:hypothetical protein
VTLFSSLANVFIDYLFISILSAPTASTDSNKDSLSADTSHTIPSTPTQEIPLAASRMNSTRVRVVHHELVEAHSAAVNSYKQLVGEERLKAEIDLRNFQKANRSTRLQSLSSPLRPVTALVTAPVTTTTVGPVNPATIDDLLTLLLQDIANERKKIRRETDKDSFDSLWGWESIVTLGSISHSISLDCSLRPSICSGTSNEPIVISEEQKAVIKRELAFVTDESNAKVLKLNRATDIHIGKKPSASSAIVSSPLLSL